MCNADCLRFGTKALAREHVAGQAVLEVGALDVNGSLRGFIESMDPASYTGVDISSGPGVDVVCDASRLLDKFDEGSIDLLVSTELMEHVKDWRKVISNFKRVLKPGGWLLMTTRSKGVPYHGYPFDFWRYEVGDVGHIFSDFEVHCVEKDRLAAGVFAFVRKPVEFEETDLADYALYSIVAKRRRVEVSSWDRRIFEVAYPIERFLRFLWRRLPLRR